MNKEEKELLLKDLCARLPYGTRIHISHPSDNAELDDWLTTGTIDNFSFFGSVKPYLRPMSSMTMEECITLSKLKPCDIDVWKYIKTPVPLYVANIEQFDFFLRHHLDWRGLIQMGLALEAPKGMYKEN